MLEKENSIAVIEIEDREIVSITLVSSKSAGIKLVNKMLRKRIRENDPDDCEYANEENCCAWCNDHCNWDAYIIDFFDLNKFEVKNK